jgi:hypothetical protein
MTYDARMRRLACAFALLTALLATTRARADDAADIRSPSAAGRSPAPPPPAAPSVAGSR